MGMVFQHFNLFNNLSVLENLTLAPVQLKIKSKEQAEENAAKQAREKEKLARLKTKIKNL
jgi:polar amino acid transport system ATP-binding protein